jgi:hypothetical protein
MEWLGQWKLKMYVVLSRRLSLMNLRLKVVTLNQKANHSVKNLMKDGYDN